MKVYAKLFCGLLLVFAFAGKILAQGAPAAGTIEVKVGQAIDSDRDASGKEYSAIVTQTVNAGGVTITQGSLAMVTLVKAADGTASVQLVSINMPSRGRVPASSSSVTVTGSPAQKATSRLGSALGARLGGIAQSAAAPIVTPTASGARVFLTPGSTLQFTFSMGGATTGAAAAAPAAPAAAPVAAPAANPAPIPASSAAATSSNGASGQLNAMEICFNTIIRDPTSGQGTMYLTAAFEVPVETLRAVPVFEPAFSAYLKASYQYTGGITCQPIWSIADAQAVQKKLADLRDSVKPKVVDTGWRYGQGPLAQGQSGFDPLAVGPGGLDLSQHRLTTYFCTLAGTAATSDPVYSNHATYVSSIFQADWDSAAVSMAYKVYIRDHFDHDLNLSNLSPACGAQSPALQAGLHQTAMISNKRSGLSVPVDFTYTAAQAAGGNAAAAQAAVATHAAAAQAAAATYFISCSTSGGAGIDTYYTDVFQESGTAHRSPNGAWGSASSQSVLDHFYAYLTQKGYNFKPGSSSACDVRPTEADAKAAHHKRAYEGGGCSTCGKVVETGWKDTP